MNAEAEDRSAMRTSIRVALLVAAGWATYVSVDDAVGPTDPILFEHFVAGAASALADNAQAQGVIAPGSAAAPATSPFAPSVAHVSGFTALSLPLPQQTPQQITPVPQPVPQQLYIGPLVVPAEPNAGAVPKSKRLQSTISNEATRVVEQPENAIGLLGPVMRDSGRHARVTPPFLMCTVEIREHAVLVSHQTIGCTQSDDGERPSMLMEFGQEVPNEIPNMQYWLSVQVDGYRNGYPILRTRMELKGLLGRAVGRRKYESVTIVQPNKKHTMIAFNIDDDDFAVTVMAKKQE